MKRTLPRTMWTLLEPIHAVVYFAPEITDSLRDLGLTGFWMSYFAGRAAPMGPIGPQVVSATFYNFKIDMVARAIPDAWFVADPETIFAVRLAAVDRALRRLLGEAVDSEEMALAADLARLAAESAEPAGRPLFAAHAQLPWPEPAHLVLWHAATLLREHRGDGHVASLLTAGLDPCEALVTMSSTGSVPRPMLQQNRGWTDEDWSAAVGRLRDKGWLDADADLTIDGKLGRDELEHLTDALAAGPWRALGTEATSQLGALLAPMTGAIAESGAVPFPNPMGVGRAT
jgi:hypothetical protein